jgi:hypothetical protein
MGPRGRGFVSLPGRGGRFGRHGHCSCCSRGRLDSRRVADHISGHAKDGANRVGQLHMAMRGQLDMDSRRRGGLTIVIRVGQELVDHMDHP